MFSASHRINENHPQKHLKSIWYVESFFPCLYNGIAAQFDSPLA